MCPAAINTKWNGEFAVLAVVNYTYASLMLARLVEMGEVTGPALHSAYTKIRNCETHDHSFCVLSVCPVASFPRFQLRPLSQPRRVICFGYGVRFRPKPAEEWSLCGQAMLGRKS